jgi:penicillin-binding protein 2A
MWKRFAFSIGIAVVLSASATYAVKAAISIPPLDPNKLVQKRISTIIYDRNKKVIAEIQPNQAEPVPLSSVPVELQQALIAIEDKNFYEHKGFDIQGILRAAYRNFSHGETVEGASTITQQLVKGVYLSSDRTYERKVRELSLAADLEKRYTKEQILALYLNHVFFGAESTGIQAASKTYFGQSIEDMKKDPPLERLAKCALLAGLPQAPTDYNPFVHPDMALKRRNLVLDAMARNGYITPVMRDQAKQAPLYVLKEKPKPPAPNAPYYVEYVLYEAAQRLHMPEENLFKGGYKIYTDFDPGIQNIMEKAFQDPNNFHPNAADGTPVQAGMVVEDPKTGSILAIMGGRGPHEFLGLNRAYQIKRQPGSSFKPLMVYGPAIDTGRYNAASILNDRRISFGGYTPQDWDRKERGQVTMRDAIRMSWNIPAVSLLNQIGVETGKAFAERAGIHFHEWDTGLALAIGGMTQGVSPIEMADAYSAFDNKGVRIPAHVIERISTDDDKTLYENKPEPVQVMKESTADAMTSLLQVVVNEGTGTNARIPGRPVAGKTGTTEMIETESGNKDAWFVGYTPRYLASVWMGFDHTDIDHYLNRGGSEIPARLFREVISRVEADLPPESFATGPTPYIKPPQQETEARKDQEKTAQDKNKEKEKGKEKTTKKSNDL